MKKRHLYLAIALLLASPPGAVASSEKEELLKLKNTTINLIDALVQQGILDKKKAQSIVEEAESKAVLDTQKELEKEKAEAARAEGQAGTGKPGAKGESAPVRVTYVPDFVKEEIRNDVRKELRDDVVKEVKTQAKHEKWGVPAALPDWVNRFKLYGDFRTRFEDQLYGSDNIPYSYINWQAVNAKGGILEAGEDAFRNVTDDRQRYRIRLRLALDAQILEHFKAGVRISTSNDRNPISINQTLGQYGLQYELALDRAFLQYDYFDTTQINWANAWVGRFANPFFSTDNMHDPDLSFEGFATALHFPIYENEDVRAYVADVPSGRQQINLGNSKPDQLFLTAGAFPLQDVFTSNQSTTKWMWAVQGGLDWLFGRSTRLKTAVAYYDYHNIVGIQNPLGSREYDWTAPQFFTKGNSLMRISNDIGELPNNPRRVGLASDFDVLDAIVSLDFGPWGKKNHLIVTGNFSDNLGFNQQEILQRTGENIEPRTKAYQVRVDVGRTNVEQFGDWSLWFAYKYLQRDSLLDAFTDSNFHLAGTDARGWVLAGNFGLFKNTWANLRWLSSDAVDGPPLAIDVLLVDLNARF